MHHERPLVSDADPVAARVGRIAQHDHVCIIYESEEERLGSVLPFVRAGLTGGDRCVYVADAPSVGATLGAMREHHVDVDGAVRAGRLVVLTARDSYLAGGRFDPDVMLDYACGAAQSAVAEGYTGLHIAGEMSWALGGDPGCNRILEYEVKVNRRIPHEPAIAICQYDRRRFSPEVIRDVIRTHPLVVIGGRVCRNFYYVPPEDLLGPNRLAREVDRLLQTILDRERAEDALRDSERRLSMSSRLAAVGTLAAGVAHEVNNPLAYLSTNLAFLAEQLSASGPIPVEEVVALREAIDESIDGAARVRDVVKGLRRFAGRQPEAAHQPIDVRGDIDAAVAIARSHVAGRAKLEVHVPASLPAVVAGPNELGQVVLNLLVNASHAIPEGDPAANRVRVEARGEGRSVIIEVSDTGAGMAPAVMSRIFDPFFTTKPFGSGTGLGLAISHGIVTAAGGTIDVRSEPARGTTFRVTLPASAEPARSTGYWDGADGQGTAERLRLLVVDDDPRVGRSLARVLGQDHDVEALTSAVQAVERIERGERWDAILCDLAMPDLSGREVAERLGRTAPDAAARLVFVTGGPVTDDVAAFLASHGRRVVEKPADPATLRAAVRAVAGRTSARRPAEEG